MIGKRFGDPIATLSNGDQIFIDDHCYIIVSPEGTLREWIYKEAVKVLKELPLPE